jgi:predicted amidophosphoribosyltransferase
MLGPYALHTASRLLASLVAPPRCGLCAGRCSWRAPVCSRCDSALDAASPIVEPSPGLDDAWSAARYEDAPRSLVAALKFARRPQLARFAAARITEYAPHELLTGGLVPVPASPARLRTRGVDAAEEIALALGRLTGLAFVPCLRRSNGPRQAGRGRALRLADPPRVSARGRAPAEAILVDDVLTTGATLAACAAALRAAGSRRVVALTYARKL